MMVLRAAEATPSTSFLSDDVASWPTGQLEALVAAGVLQRDGFARSGECDGCEERCIEDIEIVDGDPGEVPRAFIPCSKREDIRRVAVPLERLRRWTASMDGLAAELARQLGSVGAVEGVLPSRLWWLGRATFSAGRADLFLVRGVREEGATEVIGNEPRLQQSSRAVVLTTADTPADWLPGKVCISLLRLLCVDAEAGLVVDSRCIQDEVARRAGRTPHRERRFPTPPGTTWDKVAITITADLDGAQVTAGSITEPVSPDQMGMAYVGNPEKFTGEWDTLVKLSEHGRVTSEDPEARSITPKQVERLKGKLRQFFGIDEDPFKPYRQVESDDSYRAGKGLLDRPGLHLRRLVGGYEPRFVLTRIRR